MIKEAMLYKKVEGGLVYCFLCTHHCRIKSGDFGFCGVRQNVDGQLRSLVYAEAIAAGVDPIEKKPLYHFLPGSYSYSIATIGCNFRCQFCQNWQISQASKRDPNKFPGQKLEPAAVVEKALENNCKSISYTYTEPTIFFEYAYDTAKLAKEQGLYNIFVTNGYMTKQAIDKINPYLDAANVDLKSFSDGFYRKICKGNLEPVLESISYMKKLGIWVEVTTLVVPGQNDSEEELSQIAEFIAGVDKDIPWHISRFYPDYKNSDGRPTPMETLNLAYDLGKKAGLNYIYLGNTGQPEDSFCPNCKKKIIERPYFKATQIQVKKGRCIFCQNRIEGVFD
ncbi:MAG: AmmeMemoRadiSam system radical SAM enzyme [Candidatus Omnitrophica bacterium]|nr:AmmeMemoRadiSam system radical SAM enzyme [Candidatus Omnitrophota bacterium]